MSYKIEIAKKAYLSLQKIHNTPLTNRAAIAVRDNEAQKVISLLPEIESAGGDVIKVRSMLHTLLQDS